MSNFSRKFDWNHARAFLATAKTGSLSHAAIELQQTQPTIGRQVAALEEQLGTLLFDRVGQRLVLTEKGKRLVELVDEMNRSAGQIEIMAEADSVSVEGHVAVTISDNFAMFFMPHILKKAREIAPKITVDLHVQNAIEDISRREADIAIRHIRPVQSDLIARKLMDMPARLYGSKSYLEQYGHPKSVAEAQQLDMIVFGHIIDFKKNAENYGVPIIPQNVNYASTSGIVAWEMAKAGLGVIYMADIIAETSPQMEAILPDQSQIEFPSWLVTHRELHTNKRIRMIFDLMAECFTQPKEFMSGKLW